MNNKFEHTINDSIPKILFLCSFVFSCFSLLKGWDGSISDIHAFRQTQTAITVRYLLQGSNWLAYETPVLGPPWTIPLEFPLYQWIVAIIAKAGIFQIDQAGRFVSITMFLATLYPFFSIMKRLKLSTGQAFLVLSLYCLSPQYLFWSRTFMIESTALALSVVYLLFVQIYADSDHISPNWAVLLAICVAGVLAAVIKVTTFFAFCIAAAVFIAWNQLLLARRNACSKRNALQYLTYFVLFGIVIPAIALMLWTSYADSLKPLSPLGRFLTSSTLTKWNFGTMSQKLSLHTWEKILGRNIPDLIGSNWLLVVVGIAGIFCCKERLSVALASIILYLAPIAVFTNLHDVHNYYQYANGIFFISAAGIICADLWYAHNAVKRTIGVLVFLCIIVFSTRHYLKIYYPLQGTKVDLSLIKNHIDKLSKPDDIIVVFGDDWSSELPYHLGRRAVMFRSNDLNDPLFHEALNTIHNYGYNIAAVVLFNEAINNYILTRGVIQEFKLSGEIKDYGLMKILFCK